MEKEQIFRTLLNIRKEKTKQNNKMKKTNNQNCNQLSPNKLHWLRERDMEAEKWGGRYGKKNKSLEH